MMDNASVRLFRVVMLILTDGLALFCSFYLASTVVYDGFRLGSPGGMVVLLLVTLLSAYLFGGYVVRRQLSFIHIPARMSVAVLCAVVLIGAIGYVTKLSQTDLYFWRTQLIFSMLVFGVWLIASRILIRVLIHRMTQEPHWGVVGDQETGERVTRDFHQIYGEGKFSFFGDLESVQLHRLHGVIVLPDTINDAVAGELVRIRLSGTPIFNIAEFYERFLFKVPLEFLRIAWFATSAEFVLLHHDLTLRFKRLVDIVLSLVLLVLTAPLAVLAALSIFLYDLGPVFYSQVRIGMDHRAFRLYKFRTMVIDAESQGEPRWTAEKDHRITGIGKIFRITRVDELPQLWNVLRGDMSFIGPRPERPEFVADLEKAIPFYQYRHVVKPGITGWAQVMYPYGASEQDAARKLEYDLYYIRHFSLMLDIFIVLKTLRVVLSGKGR